MLDLAPKQFPSVTEEMAPRFFFFFWPEGLIALHAAPAAGTTAHKILWQAAAYVRLSGFDLREDIWVTDSSYVSVEKRALTSREAELTGALISSNPQWASVDVNSIRVVAECRCGCQSVVFAEPSELQNASAVGHQDLVGEMSLIIKTEQRDDVVSVLLHFAQGSLSLLEIIWYNFPEPIPENWTEIGREVLLR